jgi:thiol:disulfide interchange protein DsbD
VLAVAIASPCTAPFMGAALGTALSLPAAQALAVFAALGLGMALPYLALSLVPGLARALPRPGAWMARLRALLAFPMFATVVWLVWVLGRQVGVDGSAALLALLVAVGFAAWAFGPRGFGRAARLGFRSASAAGVVAALALALPLWTSVPATAVAASGAAAGERWQAWSAERVAELNAAGKPVFVDFTAAWCVTCQYNKRTTLADAELLADFDARNVVLLRADWTMRDAAISAELSRLGRSGVPVYAIYKPGAAGTPVLLSELPSVAEVRAAIGQL